jgi:hypothetical protein
LFNKKINSLNRIGHRLLGLFHWLNSFETITFKK